jgi:hypothetical protein
MLKFLIAGAALFVAGALKLTEEVRLLGRTPTLEDYLAFRCGGSEAAALTGSHGDLASVLFHCWGCYAMAAGAAIIAASLMTRFLAPRSPRLAGKR